MRPHLRAALVGAALVLAAPLAAGAAPLPDPGSGGAPVIEAGGITFGFHGHDGFRGFRSHRGFRGFRGFRGHRGFGGHFLHQPKRFPHVFHHPKRFHHEGFRHRGLRHKRFHHRGFPGHGFRHRGSGILLFVPGVGLVIR